MRARAALATLLLATAGPACAQQGMDAATNEKFSRFVGSNKNYFDWLQVRLAQAEPVPLRETCAAVKATKRIRLLVTKPPTFTDTPFPASGAWIEQLTVDRCGSEAVRSILVDVRDSRAQAIPLLPGRTNAAPLLQRDAALPAEVAAKVKVNCKDRMYVVDTAIEGDARPGAPWRETWTFMGCKGTQSQVAMTFTPDGNGGTNFQARAK
ncbi:MAG: hypothetical protein IT563_18075 [Alphaproteobacteria bacterium]|nr:hypothetical protein [Alphaproteobacteria bacterium]